jgi:hypothetical protein
MSNRFTWEESDIIFDPSPPDAATHSSGAAKSASVCLVACASRKLNNKAKARDLYDSALFNLCRAYAERMADRWYVLSAKHHLLDPDRVIAPYSVTLKGMSAAQRRRWAERVMAQLSRTVPSGSRIVMLAGERYREYIVPVLESRGCMVDVPLAGLRIGQQLHYLKGVLDATTGTGD